METSFREEILKVVLCECKRRHPSLHYTPVTRDDYYLGKSDSHFYITDVEIISGVMTSRAMCKNRFCYRMCVTFDDELLIECVKSFDAKRESVSIPLADPGFVELMCDEFDLIHNHIESRKPARRRI